MCIYTCIHIHTYTFLYSYVCILIWIWIYIYMYMYMYICIYIKQKAGNRKQEQKTNNRGEKREREKKRKMATKWVPKARIRVSTLELAIIFRGESVSGHPGSRGGPKIPENRPENFPKTLEFSKKTMFMCFVCPQLTLPENIYHHRPCGAPGDRPTSL